MFANKLHAAIPFYMMLATSFASTNAIGAPQTFTNTGGPQIYVVPDGVTAINVELHGSQGTAPDGVSANPGRGAVVNATIAVTPGEVLQLMVGDTFGFNGGTAGGGGATGGGATDIRRPAFSTVSSCAYTLTCPLGQRIIVAGGGGATGSFPGSNGGDGGLNATAGTSAGTGSTAGGPGTASAGGAAGSNSGGGAEGLAGNGSLGHGGVLGWKPNNYGGGGGGGFYGGGGGGGATDVGASGGGGGSSWDAGVSAGLSNVVYTDAVNAGEGKIVVDVASAIPNASFAYTGTTQIYTVANDVTNLAVMLAGARGSASGDVVYGRLPVVPGAQLQVVVGGRGEERVPALGTGVLSGGNGGFNGGGDSLLLDSSGYGGGGASDLRVSPFGLEDRVVVAGGGGGVYGFFVQFGWYGAAGGAETDGRGGTSSRNSWEPHGQGGQLTAGGRLLINCHVIVGCEPDLTAAPTTSGLWLNGGDGDNQNRSGGGGGYYGGAANHGGGGGSSFATVTGVDPTQQGVGNVLGTTGAAFQHSRGSNSGDGFAVITAMPVAITGEATIQAGNFMFSGTVNPKHFATNPVLYFGTNQQEVETSSSGVIQLQDSGSNTLLAGNQVINLTGSTGGAQNEGTYYYKVCAQTVAGLSCGNVRSIDVVPEITLTFVDWDGGLISSIVTIIGEAVTPPSAPVREGYTFTGWSVTNFSALVADTTITAMYSINSYTLSFNSAGGSAVASQIVEYGAQPSLPANPTREGYTFIGWSPTLPEAMPAQNQTLTAQWLINKYTIQFNSAGGSVVAPLTLDFNSAITVPAPTRAGYTFKGWSPALPATMPATPLQVTAQWYESSVDVTSTGGSMSLISLCMLVLVAVFRRIKRLGFISALVLSSGVQASDWVVEGGLGSAASTGVVSHMEVINNTSSINNGVATLQQNNDTGYRLLLAYKLRPDWFLEAGWTDLGDLIISYTNLPENTPNKLLAYLQPQRGNGIELATRYYFMTGDSFKPYLRVGMLLNREKYQIDWVSRSEQESDSDKNLLYGLGVDYQLNERFTLGLSAHRYNTYNTKTNLVLLNLQYHY